MSWMHNLQSKIISPSNLQKTVQKIRSAGKKIVFTNGCFDIIHKGHVSYLAQAADLGDVLIVGVNSDTSVKRQGKGDERPINDLEARKVVLAGLEFVGGVIEFDGDTPIELIKQIKPDVLVKGADYDPDMEDPTNKKYIVGREVVLENGGEVKAIALVPGFSTTSIVNKLQS